MAVDIKLKRSHTHSNIPTTSDLSEGEFAINTYDGKMYMRDGSSNIVTVGSHYTTDFESTTKTFYVTVATSTSDHVHHGNGSSNKYKINGVFSPYLKLIPGITYRFDQSDSSNSGHPFRFYLDENKNTAYTTGVTTNGTAGSSGAYTQIVVTHSTPPVLHYQCSAHGLMGWAAFVNTSNLTAFDTGDLTEGSNLYYTNARADARVNLQTGANLDLSSKDTDDLSEGSSNLYYTDARAQAVSINNVVEDTTPQLGGNLDVNDKNITFGDSSSPGTDNTLILGDSNDLRIYHNGTHSFIHDNGTGQLRVRTNEFRVLNASNNEILLNAVQNGEVNLYHDNAIKLSTTSTGIQVKSVDTSSSAGPVIALYRDSSSPADADYLGQLQFKGKDDGGADETYAKVTGKIADASAGTEDGLIETAIKGNGSFTIVSRQRSDELQLLNGVGLSVAGTLGVTGNTTLSGTLNGHTIPGGSGTLALTTDIQSGGVTIQDEGSSLSTLGTTLNFVGAGVTASGTGATKTITISGGGGSGSGQNVSWSVTQSSHGLAVGDVIYNNGSAYVKAQANATGTLGLFVVSAVADTNTFTATFSGKITLSSLTAGQYYFVSTTSAGDFTATEPTSGYSNPILFALSTTEAVVLPFRPQDLTAGGAAGARTALDVFSKSETNAQISAFSIALG